MRAGGRAPISGNPISSRAVRFLVNNEENAMAAEPDPRPRERSNIDTERDTRTGETVRPRDGDTSRTVGPEDEDRRVRPGERRPPGTMP